MDTSTVAITVNHQVLGQGEHDALSKETSCKNKHKSERFLPFLFTNTLFTEVPVTDGHVLHQKIFTKVDEVHSVGSPPSPSGVSPVKCFLTYFSSSSHSNPPLLTFTVRFAGFLLCIVGNEIFVRIPFFLYCLGLDREDDRIVRVRSWQCY